jgi:heme o synthase
MKSKLRNKLYYYLALSKLKIMVPVSLTGFTGYFICDSRITIKLFIISFGILLMAISATVLNQIQENELDSKMRRTHNRPIPAGKITINQAIVYFFFTLLTGILVLYTTGNPLAAIIGFITILWYNGIYTYLKRVTVFAVLPGAITGALPPLIGWVAAGGAVWDNSIIIIGFLIFICQMPHFWLIILKYGNEYEEAGIPCLTSVLNISQINRITFIWIVTTVVVALFLYHVNIIQTGLIMGILLLASLIIIWQFSDLLKMKVDKNNYGKYSLLLNSYFLLVILLLISDRILS